METGSRWVFVGIKLRKILTWSVLEAASNIALLNMDLGTVLVQMSSSTLCRSKALTVHVLQGPE